VAPKEESVVSSPELVQGTPLVPPGKPPVRPTSYAAAANTLPVHLREAAYVYMRHGGQPLPLASPYAGPLLVSQKGAKTLSIKITD